MWYTRTRKTLASHQHHVICLSSYSYPLWLNKRCLDIHLKCQQKSCVRITWSMEITFFMVDKKQTSTVNGCTYNCWRCINDYYCHCSRGVALCIVIEIGSYHSLTVEGGIWHSGCDCSLLYLISLWIGNSNLVYIKLNACFLFNLICMFNKQLSRQCLTPSSQKNRKLHSQDNTAA